MLLDAGDVRPQQGDAHIEFIQRIAVEAFAGEEAGCAQAWNGQPPWSIIVVHQSLSIQRRCPCVKQPEDTFPKDGIGAMMFAVKSGD